MAAFIKRGILFGRLAIVAVHMILITLAYVLAYLLRFDFSFSPDQWVRFLGTLPFLLLIRLTVFSRFHLYEEIWRYVSMQDILALLKAVTLSSLLFVASVFAVFGHSFPRSIFVLEWVLCLALVGGARLTTRAFRESSWQDQRVDRKRAVVVGAGDAGEMLIREIERSLTLNCLVVGVLDDDPRKQSRRVHGIKVMGLVDQLPVVCKSLEVEEILIAIPSATQKQRLRVFRYCRESGVPFKSIPALNELLQGDATIGHLREVRTEDLLGREPVKLDFDSLRQGLQGKRILVTGAGGSIGSELCRQLAAFDPELLVLFDRSESSLFFIDIELRRHHPELRIIPVIGDVLDGEKVEEVLKVYTPQIVYHTAAYKHVPLMEEHPLEAIQNNVFGTEIVGLAACRTGVKKFIFISTDKAVKPVGIMGMTKRIAECLLLSLNKDSTKCLAVRFGNVLESDGSVLPLFRWQIANGGPVTVTDPDASRYFMLLSEASQLVIQAGEMGHGGEIFFLDMGEPVKILDLAQTLIEQSELKTGKAVPIEIIGLRPGERLQEELVMQGERLLRSEHEKVFKVQTLNFEAKKFGEELDSLRDLVQARDRKGAIACLQKITGQY